MYINKDWIYREINGCHILVSMSTNRIISISPAMSELFLNDSINNIDDLFEKWLKKYNIDSASGHEMAIELKEKGVFR